MQKPFIISFLVVLNFISSYLSCPCRATCFLVSDYIIHLFDYESIPFSIIL
nr:MAG TPA: hypothetical protein [Caudoviricetes sp.]